MPAPPGRTPEPFPPTPVQRWRGGATQRNFEEQPMRRFTAAAILAASVSATLLPLRSVLAQPAPAAPAAKQEQPQQQTDVPVKVVVLFSSGVGYFEHFGKVAGNGTTELRFKTQQINDVLK